MQMGSGSLRAKHAVVATAPFRPGDAFCGVWHLLGLLQGGAAGWEPKYKYKG